VSWNLYFMRHGIASNAAIDGTYFDELRPLTDSGRHRATLVVRSLVQMEGKVDVIFHSPLLRAQQTAEIAAHELGVTTLIETRSLFPESHPEELEGLLVENLKPGQNAMLVGHQPNMSAALSWMISGQLGSMLDMSTGGLACIRFAGKTYGGPGVLEWLITPKWAHIVHPDEKW
jgi:phosphohistidine phosphatase